MYVPRLLKSTFVEVLKQFPAVLLTGPRQAGKTTFLSHEVGKTAAYASLDDPLERSFALSDPNGFLDRFGEKSVILDEIQYVPEIFPYLKIRIDRDRKRNGKWILTGSQQFQLMKNVRAISFSRKEGAMGPSLYSNLSRKRCETASKC
jgi:predicted AAA+ superfamily ATPase